MDLNPALAAVVLGADAGLYSPPHRGPGALRAAARLKAKIAAHPPLPDKATTKASRQVERRVLRKAEKRYA